MAQVECSQLFLSGQVFVFRVLTASSSQKINLSILVLDNLGTNFVEGFFPSMHIWQQYKQQECSKSALSGCGHIKTSGLTSWPAFYDIIGRGGRTSIIFIYLLHTTILLNVITKVQLQVGMHGLLFMLHACIH